jgi:hypothetical protein
MRLRGAKITTFDFRAIHVFNAAFDVLKNNIIGRIMKYRIEF